ncbi:hypothetical protein BC936DRAFT_142493, partial [Jimgerdemannia flammicorona]
RCRRRRHHQPRPVAALFQPLFTLLYEISSLVDLDRKKPIVFLIDGDNRDDCVKSTLTKSSRLWFFMGHMTHKRAFSHRIALPVPTFDTIYQYTIQATMTSLLGWRVGRYEFCSWVLAVGAHIRDNVGDHI